MFSVVLTVYFQKHGWTENENRPGDVAQLGERLPNAGGFELQSQSCIEPGRAAPPALKSVAKDHKLKVRLELPETT